MKGYIPSILLLSAIPSIYASSIYLSNLMTSVIVLLFTVTIIYTLSWTVEEKGITNTIEGCDKN